MFMAYPAKLEINLAEEFPRLARAPIVEAVIGIRARAQAPWEEAAVAQSLKGSLPDYPDSQPLAHMAVKLGSDQRGVPQDLGWDGFRFQNLDGKQIGAFTRDGFVFSRLQPYPNWEQFFGEAIRLWQIHDKVAKPMELQRVELRFINRIEMPRGDFHFEDYIKHPPEPTEGLELPFDGFFHQDMMTVPGHPLAVNVVRTIQPPSTPNCGVAVILDIYSFTTAEVNQKDLAQRLLQMRWLKNKVFFGNITEKALNLFR